MRKLAKKTSDSGSNSEAARIVASDPVKYDGLMQEWALRVLGKQNYDRIRMNYDDSWLNYNRSSSQGKGAKMATKRVKVRTRIKKAGAHPPCWHNCIDSDGFCLECGKRAAIKLEPPKTMTAGSGQQPATAGNRHPFADISSL